MSVSVKIEADSVNPYGSRLTSFLVTFPRWILAEVNTHRALSRNAASSRAIPLSRMIDEVQKNPAVPEYWGKIRKGMQAAEEIDEWSLVGAFSIWMIARDDAVITAQALDRRCVHKQIANRILEPWAHVTMLITGSDWGNFFSLRAHKDAQPEFQVLAYRMLDRYLKSTPQKLKIGEWHMPFRDRLDGLDTSTALKVVTARAARLSYLTFDGEFSVEADCKLHDHLVSNGHMSPTEQAAQAVTLAEWVNYTSNFGRGWKQYRKSLPNESREYADISAILASKPDWISLEDDAV